MIVKLEWNEISKWGGNGNTLLAAEYMQSSIYKPSSTASTRQPMYWDQLANLYTNFRVYGMKYKLTCHSTNTKDMYWFAVRHQDNVTAETDIQTLMERPDAKVVMGGEAGGRSITTIKGYMDVAKTLGIAKSQIKNNESLRGTTGGNPPTMVYLRPYVFSSGALVDAQTFDFTWKIVFYAEVYGLRAVAAS